MGHIKHLLICLFPLSTKLVVILFTGLNLGLTWTSHRSIWMQFEITDGLLKKAMTAFLVLGACSYGAMFVTYILWFMGLID